MPKLENERTPKIATEPSIARYQTTDRHPQAPMPPAESRSPVPPEHGVTPSVIACGTVRRRNTHHMVPNAKLVYHLSGMARSSLKPFPRSLIIVVTFLARTDRRLCRLAARLVVAPAMQPPHPL